MLRTTCQRSSFFVVIALALMTIVSCSNQEENKKPAPKPEAFTAAVAPAPEPLRVEPEKTDMPPVEAPGQLVLSPSAETGSELYTSWPLIISVSLWRKALIPDAQDNLPAVAPITIKAKQGAWRDALVVEVRNASDEPVVWPLHPVPQPETSVTLGVDETASAQWWLEPAETQELAPGVYALTVSFRPDAVEGLPSSIGSDRFHLKIEKEPASLDQATATAKQLQMAEFSLFKGDAKTAGSLVEQLLAGEPENIGVLRLQAKLLMGEGKKLEAANALEEALHVYYRKYPNADPPLGLLHERSEAMKDLERKIIKESGPAIQ
jgi:hypothetical protein